MNRPDPTSIATALGRIPSGLFIVTTRLGEERLGFLGSLVQQIGFEPPTVCIAMAKDRQQSTSFAEAGRFALSILDEQSAGLRSVFLKRLPEGQSPFDGLSVGQAASGTPVLLDALAWIDCVIVARHDTADHVVFFGEVVEAQVMRAGRPHVHVRKNGLAY
jgi:flavin reductase (DIM6/NTAB) family NADH-FMN oxidoreductase RutF